MRSGLSFRRHAGFQSSVARSFEKIRPGDGRGQVLLSRPDALPSFGFSFSMGPLILHHPTPTVHPLFLQACSAALLVSLPRRIVYMRARHSMEREYQAHIRLGCEHSRSRFAYDAGHTGCKYVLQSLPLRTSVLRRRTRSKSTSNLSIRSYA